MVADITAGKKLRIPNLARRRRVPNLARRRKNGTQFGERVGHEGWLIGPKLFRPKAYPTCVSSKLCEFIADECFFYFLPLKVFKDFKTTNDGKYDISYPLLWGQGVVWSLRVHLRSSCANVPLLSSLELIEKRVWLLLQLENDRCIRWFSVRGKCCSSSAPIYKAALCK